MRRNSPLLLLITSAGWALAAAPEPEPELPIEQPVLAPAAEPSVDETDREIPAGAVIRCCTGDLESPTCETVPAEQGCRVVSTSPAAAEKDAAEELAAAVEAELTAPLAWFTKKASDYRTPRGRIAAGLRSPVVTDVFIGTVEGEHAFEGDRLNGTWGIMTWCQVRVHRVFRGHLAADDVIDVLYDGGSLGQGFSSWPAHGSRCLPFDYGLFSLHVTKGILRPHDASTFSMLASGVEWPDHPFTAVVEALATEKSSVSQ